jgi:hypothetical protein
VARKDARLEFAPRFEGREALDGLLDLAGAALDAPGVLERFQEAFAAGQARSEVIPTLFVEEPRFPDPELAKRLYENLFGLWELVASGRPVALDSPLARPERVPRSRPPSLPPPGPFGQAPDEAWVEEAWRYLGGLDGRAVERLWHGFENRQDALGVYLNELGLPDNAYAQANELLFELWAMLEAGWPKGLRSVTEVSFVPSAEPGNVPEALRSFVNEAIFEAEQDETKALSVEQSAQVRRAVNAGLEALWNARRS